MKLKTGEIFVAVNTARALAEEKLPFKAKYWIARFLTKAASEYDPIELQRTELLKKHGTLTENGTQYTLNKDTFKLYSDEFEGILSQEIDVDLPSIPASTFGDVEIKTDLTPLNKFITE